MKGRGARVEDLLRSEIARILQRDMRDPRLGLATVSYIKVSGDLSHAEVGVSVLGDDKVRESSVETLCRARGFIRSRLAKSVHLRKVPELDFLLDRGPEHSQRISDILETLDDDTEST